MLALKGVPPAERSLATILTSLYRHHAEVVASRTDVLSGDKTPMNVEALDEIFEVFPDARVIHMLRDGIDVVHSLMERSFELHAAAERWSRSLDLISAAAARYPGHLRTIRYEDLVAAPVQATREVCEFVGARYSDEPRPTGGDATFRDVEAHPYLRSALKPVFTESIGRGRRNLTAAQVSQVLRIVGGRLRDSGYGRD